MPYRTCLSAVLLAMSLCMTPAALAQPQLDGALANHAVIQRDQPITISGRSKPGETVMISLADRSVSTTTDAAGRFTAELPPLSAGGPHVLTLAAASGATILRDILVGDVFLCSGQSNMEMQVNQSQSLFAEAHPDVDPDLRLLTVAKRAATAPAAALPTSPQWQVAGPETATSFSAACFYMAQALRRDSDVPVGAIHASWGGSRISAWLSDPALRQSGLAVEADLLALYDRDPLAATRQAAATWEAWWRTGTGDAPGREPWQPDTALRWQPVPAMTNFESWGVPALQAYNGMLWYQRVVDLSAAQAAGTAVLSLGMIDDADQTWVNGTAIGGTSLAGTPRVYVLPAGTLQRGRNVITVNNDDVYALGGMIGPADTMRLTLADGTTVPLGERWRYAIAAPVAGSAPRVPWDDINGASTLFNAMIAPLGPIRLAGIAWYQGESDTGVPEHDRRLRALIADWRGRFGSAQTGFAVAQLANYGKPATAPVESGWGVVRDAQRRVVAEDAHVGLAVTLDIGDAADIHPGQKLLVGQRLARAMQAALAGSATDRAGPAILRVERAGDDIVLHFTGVSGALRPSSSSQAIGFELCGPAPQGCRFATARADSTRVILTGDGQPVARIRYAWADAPATNLWDDARLPVGTFEISVP